MGFITPGIRYVFDKKRKGRNDKAFNFSVHANENKNFNRRFPNNLYFRYYKNIHKLYAGILKTLKGIDEQFGHDELNLLRTKVEKYITFVHELEIFVGAKNLYPLNKQEAINLLRIIIQMQGNDLFRRSNESVLLSKAPPLEATLNRQLDLIEGGCILFNKYLNKQLTVDLKTKNYYGNNNETDFSKTTLCKVEDDVHSSIFDELLSNKKRNITDLPDNLLVKILSYSNNINNVSLTCKYFHNFVLSHLEFISYEILTTRYVHRYKLNGYNEEVGLEGFSDEHHHVNSHTLKIDNSKMNGQSLTSRQLISSGFKQNVNRHYTSTRYRDPDNLTIISSHGFETPYLTYEIYKSLHIDHVIPASAWLDLEEKYNKEISQLNNEGSSSHILDKKIFEELWNELPINVPYMDISNPLNLMLIKNEAYVDKLRIIIDLMLLKTRFRNKLEEILMFVVALTVKIEENIFDNSTESLIPVQIIKDYAIYYTTQNMLENDDTASCDQTDEEIWEGIRFKNPLFYVLLRQSANEELETALCPLFLHDEIKDNVGFWMDLKKMNQEELIEQLINDFDISPASHILNMLVF